jgi:di/tripeptidase
MAHDINWYRKQHKIWMAERQGYIDKAEQADAHTAAAVKQAVEAAEAAARAVLTEYQKAHFDTSDELYRRNNEVISIKQMATDLRANAEEQLRLLRQRISDDAAKHAAELAQEKDSHMETAAMYRRARDQADAAAPIVELAEAKVRDLQALLDNVRSSMTKKQLADESAILNRQVLAGAIPGRRRRA